MPPVLINPLKIQYIYGVDWWIGISYDIEERLGSLLAEGELMHQSGFSLSLGDCLPRCFELDGHYVEIKPSQSGLPLVRDFDVLIFCISWLQNAYFENRHEDINQELQFSVRDFLIFCGRGCGGSQYQILQQALKRLSGSEISTNIPSPEIGGKQEEGRFNLISFEMVRSNDGCIGKVNISLPDKLYRLFSNRTSHLLFCKVLNPGYFKLKPLQRAIYWIARMNCGTECPVTVSLAELHRLTGVLSPLRNFKIAIREVIGQPLLEYLISTNEDSSVLRIDRVDSTTPSATHYIKEIFGESEDGLPMLASGLHSADRSLARD
jgi:hypothetical protein